MNLELSPKKIIVGASKNNGLLAQLGEHRLDKAGVPGSKPGQATTFGIDDKIESLVI